jgi:O-antigen/teichoic acid export membrane protein
LRKSIIGLFTTLPLYYFLGTKGIVPGIIVTALTSLLLTWYYSSKLEVHNISVSKKKTIAEGKGMLKLGFMISISGLITLAASYFVRIFIRNHGGVDQVGLYNAGFAIINTYVGMIFTAMSTDYFPRLSAVHKNNKESGLLINQQAEMALLILAPILMIFFVFSNLVVIVLYSKQFLPVTSMLYWAALGMFFKAGSWSISFIFLAKGDSKFYFWNELITNIYIFCFNILGYYYYGLTGLGLSFLISYFIYFVQVYLIAKIKYEFKFNSGFFKIFTIQFILGLLTITVVFSLSEFSSYFVGSILIAISLCFSIMELNKRIELKNIVSSFIKKIKKR